MTIVHQGDLADRPWGAILWRLAVKFFSGEITINIAGKDVRLAIHQGLLVGAESPFAADGSLRIAAQSQIVSAAQVAALAGKVTGSRAEAEAIGRLAGLSPQDTARLRRRAMAQSAARTFQVEQGPLQIADQIDIDTAESLALDVRTIIMVGARQHFTLDRVHHELARFGDAFVMPPPPADTLPAFAMSQVEQMVVEVLASEGTFDQMCRRAPQTDPLVVGCVMYALLCCGLLTVTQGVPASRARTTSLGGQSSGHSGIRAMPSANPLSGAHQMPRANTHQSGVHQMPRPGTHQSGVHKLPQQNSHQSGVHPMPRMATQSGGHRVPTITDPGHVSGARRPTTQSLPPGLGSTAATAEQLIADKLAIIDRGGNHYELLGVDNSVNEAAIAKAYFALARQLHPDKIAALGIVDQERAVERVFAQINIAFTVLSDKSKRAAYHEVLKAGGAKAVSAQDAELQKATAAMIAGEEAYRRGQLALRNEDFVTALEEFDRAISFNPKEGEYVAFKAWTMWVAAPDRATAMIRVKPLFDTAKKLAPNGASVPFLLGRIARIEGRIDEATRQFQTAISRQPNHQEALIEIRAIRARHGR